MPRITWNAAFLTTLVAIFGTTISPYLFFWQASQEAEDNTLITREAVGGCLPRKRLELFNAFARILWWAGVFQPYRASNYFHYSCHAQQGRHHGCRNIRASRQALKPVAGNLAFVIFSLGIIGTGLLAVRTPGSAAYAVGEALKCRLASRESRNTPRRFIQY